MFHCYVCSFIVVFVSYNQLNIKFLNNGDPDELTDRCHGRPSSSGTTTLDSSFYQAPCFLAIGSTIMVCSSASTILHAWNHQSENIV